MTQTNEQDMTLLGEPEEESGLEDLLKAPEQKPLRAEDIWPFRDKVTGLVIPDPSFEDYIWWMHELEWRKQIMADLNMPRTFQPRPYQVEGAVWLRQGTQEKLEILDGLVKLPARSCKMVYDQPGLGKTLQACMALKPPAIVSCPGYLVQQWADFIADQYPQWKVAAITQNLWREKRQEMLDDDSYDIWVVNHEMWAARREPFRGGQEPKRYLRGGRPNPEYSFEKWNKWYEAKSAHDAAGKKKSYHWPKAKTLIIDESHHMRNREASQSQSIAAYADTCDYVFLLTASPQYKDVRDWWNQLRIMAPREYRSYHNWEETYAYQFNASGTLWKVRSSRAEALKEEIATYAIGRHYNDVGLYLPPIIEKEITVNWDPTVWKAYKDLRDNMAIESENGYRVDINPSSMLHTLRLFTANPDKVEAVKKLLEDIPGDDPIILFCWYRDCAEMLAEEFELDPSSVRIHGGYSQSERLRRAAAKDSRVKCVTMASASEGVDWSAASTVVFFEEDYTPGKMYQAMSRVRRWSKTGENEGKAPILVYYVHMAHSVDQAVHYAVTERNGDVRRILRRALK